jgi:hypothetical protein
MAFYPNPDSSTLAGSHRKMLYEESGIYPVVATERGYYTAKKRSEAPEEFKNYQRKAGLVVPIYSPDGKTRGYQLRPDVPRKDKKGKALKYETPGASRALLDAHPTMRSRVASGEEDLWLTEGIKKADALTSRDLPTIGIIGVWNFQRDGEPLPCWDHVQVAGRRVYVVYDNDVMVKEAVQLALSRLVGMLEGRGAEVLVVYLPAGELKGVDNYLAAGHTVAELRMLARKFEPADVGRIRLSRDEKLRVAVEDLQARWWSYDWSRMVGTGENPNSMRGHTARDTMKALIDAAVKHGKPKTSGIEVRISTRTLALDAAASRPSVGKALHNLQADGLIKILEAKSEDKARTYRLLTTRAGLSQDGSRAHAEKKVSNSREATDRSGKGLRGASLPDVSRLRWSSPGRSSRRGFVTGTRKVRESVPAESFPSVRRLGKIRGSVIDALEIAGGRCTLAELCEVLQRSRPRDLRRRVLPMLEDAGILTVEANTIELVDGWAVRLEEVRAADGEIERDDLDRERYRTQRESFRRRDEIVVDTHPANGNADGFIEDLQPPNPEPEPELVTALRKFLHRNPRRRAEQPSWFAVALWADGYVEGKPALAETAAALDWIRSNRRAA